MGAILSIFETIFDALFPPRKSELLLRHTPDISFDRLVRLIVREDVEALLPYGDPRTMALIWELKYYGSMKAALIGGRALASHIEGLLAEEMLERPVLVAVPLHATRLKERGYNQAERLAHACAVRLGRAVSYAPEALLRVRKTERQTDLPRRKRLANVRGAFEVARRSAVVGRTCILIDDVLTTGSTLSEAADVLRKAGARQVFPIALAYAE